MNGMRFDQFSDYLHERCVLLERNNLSAEQRLALSQAIMREEDAWLDWKATQEILDSWLGISKEIND